MNRSFTPEEIVARIQSVPQWYHRIEMALGIITPGINPLIQFYPRDSLNADFTNYWAPNELCMVRMLEESRFHVRRVVPGGARAIFECEVVEDERLAHLEAISRGIF